MLLAFLQISVYHNEIFHTKISRARSRCDSRPIPKIDNDKKEHYDTTIAASIDADNDCDNRPNKSCVNEEDNRIQDKNVSREDGVAGERLGAATMKETKSKSSTVVIVDIQPPQNQTP